MKFVNLSSLLRDSSETDNLLSLVASKGLSLDFVTVSTSGNINDYDTSNESSFRFTGASEIRGFGAGRDGKIIYVYNGSASNILIVNQSTAANSDDRIITGTGSDFNLAPDTAMVLQYDGTSARWRIPGFRSNQSLNTSDSVVFGDVSVTDDILVTGTVSTCNIHFTANGTAAAPAASWNNNTGVFTCGSGTFGISTSGCQMFYATTTGVCMGQPGSTNCVLGTTCFLGNISTCIYAGLCTSYVKIDGKDVRSGCVALSCGTVDLSVQNRPLLFEFNENAASGATTSGDINFTNGTAGDVFYVKINSGGSGSYAFGSNMCFPGEIAPVPSACHKIDIYSFLAVGTNKFLGTFAFNYS
jgi:hypothetical protein